MSYNVLVRHTADSGSGISVEARVNGEPVAHTFPKGMGFFEEPESGKPPYVEKLIEKYEEKMKRQGKTSIQNVTAEEAKIHSSYFENCEYGDRSKNFKDEDKVNNDMTSVDLENPSEIREYLKENMAEGYLSEEEGLNIDKFVDRYQQLLENSSSTQEIIRKIHEDRVQ